MGTESLPSRGNRPNDLKTDMKWAIVTAFHKYTPFGGEYYEPILDFYLQNMKKWHREYDHIYLMDSNWEIDPKKIEGMKASIIRVDPHLRYYDAYKEILPQIKESLVLFTDNDMVVYKPGVISSTFEKLQGDYDVVSIYDTIGERTFKELNGKSKFCPYWFATGTAMLKDFTKCEWGPVPWGETLSDLTLKMLDEQVIPFEQEEDKSSLLFDGTEYYPNGTNKSKDLGYYHIRAGSTPTYLLATKKYGDPKTYWDYIKNQPKHEYLRQVAWFYTMCDANADWMTIKLSINEMLEDMDFNIFDFQDYWDKFRKYHGLI